MYICSPVLIGCLRFPKSVGVGKNVCNPGFLGCLRFLNSVGVEKMYATRFYCSVRGFQTLLVLKKTKNIFLTPTNVIC